MLHPISRNEVKHMIINGSFEKEKGHRLSKNYTIEYVDVSNDDATELQKDFTFIQERLNYVIISANRYHHSA